MKICLQENLTIGCKEKHSLKYNIFKKGENMNRDLSLWKNKLIVFEGGDKTGKTSVAKALVEYLNENGGDAIFTFQPGDPNWGVIAPQMRSMCKDKRWDLHPMATFHAFQLDRIEQIDKVIIPALKAGKTVVSDRWNFSTFAYQLHGQQLLKEYNMPKDVMDWLLNSSNICQSPNNVFYFPEKLDVKREEEAFYQYESVGDNFMDRVHNAYETLNNTNDNWIRVTPGSSVKATLTSVLDLMEGKSGN
jgi:dTMP kinase